MTDQNGPKRTRSLFVLGGVTVVAIVLSILSLMGIAPS